MNESISLTETELELMHILWRIGEGNVKTVMESLPEERDLAYTSVSTILRILVKKGVCRVRSEGRNHFYIPELSKEDFEKSSLDKVIQQVFLGNASNLVKRLVGSGKLSSKEREALEAIIEGEQK